MTPVSTKSQPEEISARPPATVQVCDAEQDGAEGATSPGACCPTSAPSCPKTQAQQGNGSAEAGTPSGAALTASADDSRAKAPDNPDDQDRADERSAPTADAGADEGVSRASGGAGTVAPDTESGSSSPTTPDGSDLPRAAQGEAVGSVTPLAASSSPIPANDAFDPVAEMPDFLRRTA